MKWEDEQQALSTILNAISAVPILHSELNILAKFHLFTRRGERLNNNTHDLVSIHQAYAALADILQLVRGWECVVANSLGILWCL